MTVRRGANRCAAATSSTTTTNHRQTPSDDGDLWSHPARHTPSEGRFCERMFGHAGLPYFNPHSFRKTLALLGGRICKSPEEYEAWSQNLGHESVLTTFSSYGDVAGYRQAEIIRGFQVR
jgi:hypothetical protein